MYEKALKSYAKKTSEKRELRVKIHELEKELGEKSLNDYIARVEHKSAMDRIGTQTEINQTKRALKNYAKTTEQKWQLEEKLHELKKQLEQEQEERLQNNLNSQVKKIEDAMEKKEQIERCFL